MRELTDSELWARVRPLQGQVVYTPAIGKPSLITEVTEDEVLRTTPDGSKSITPASRVQVFSHYDYVWQKGIFTREDYPGVPVLSRRNGCFILALLAAAVPKQIQTFRGDNPWRPGKSGIKLKWYPW